MKRLLSILKWLYPGMRVKRWILIALIGVALVTTGMGLLVNFHLQWYLAILSHELLERAGIRLRDYYLTLGLILIVLGLGFILISFRQLMHSVASVISPADQKRLADVIYRKRFLSQGQNIVVLGGGTGLSTLLRGLKEFTSNITAIVTVTDDGGSSGRLVKELGVPPPGDIRNCLVALADAEPLMTQLFQHRFQNGAPDLTGHSFGNLLIAALTTITGDFEKALQETSNILAIRGRVLPSTLSHVTLCAELADGRKVAGETNISRCQGRHIRRILLNPTEVYPMDETLEAIRTASIIVIGPGSVYTSVVPNLLVKGIPEAIAASRAIKIYVCNVMTQPGETAGYTASDHVRAIMQHSSLRLFDYVLVNVEHPSPELLERYQLEGADFVIPDTDQIQAQGFHPIRASLISQTEVVRHDPHKLAEAIINLSMQAGF